MKKSILNPVPLMLVVFFILQGCSQGNNSSANKDDLTEELNGFIGKWHQSAASSEHTGYIGAMAEDGIYIGTDALENWTTKEFSEWSRPYFEKKRGWNLEALERHIYIGNDGQTAWFDELLDTGMGLCRGSGVLQNINGSWKISHYVLSPTVPNDLISQVKTLKSSQDSLIISSLKSKQ